MNKVTLRASATTRPQDLAGAVAKYITVDKQDVEVVVVGAGALSQAMKGLIIAKRFISGEGLNLKLDIGFRGLIINNKEITGIVLGVVAD